VGTDRGTETAGTEQPSERSWEQLVGPDPRALAPALSPTWAAALSTPGRGAGRGATPTQILALQRAAGNRWLSRQLAKPGDTRSARQLQRDTPDSGVATADAGSPPPAPTPLATFTATISRRFGVKDVHVGTESEQRNSVTPGGALGTAPATATLPSWKRWQPDATVYPEIIGAFDDTANVYGGLPRVEKIVFYEVDYQWDSGMQAFVPRRESGAWYSAGTLTVYHTAATVSYKLPVARSNQSGKYPDVAIGDKPSGGAPRPYSSPAEWIRRTIVHELGHGVQEAVVGGAAKTGPDPTMLADFALAVGWWPPANVGAQQLYDIQDPAVASAIAQKQTPTKSPITGSDWNDPKWGEQPISGYSLTGPFEDFAESFMAYAYASAVLKARSPARWTFIDGHKAKWKPGLRQPTP
jgi:hypothetical protein